MPFVLQKSCFLTQNAPFLYKKKCRMIKCSWFMFSYVLCFSVACLKNKINLFSRQLVIIRI